MFLRWSVLKEIRACWAVYLAYCSSILVLSAVAGEFPDRLSMTGLFDNVETLHAGPQTFFYEINSPFWSNSAEKSRWIFLPQDKKVNFNAKGEDVFPNGAQLIKHFNLVLPSGELRHLETRILKKTQQGWVEALYLWNENRTDAFLQEAPPEDQVFTVDGSPWATSNPLKINWSFPVNRCVLCHQKEGSVILGFRPEQLDREIERGGKKISQINFFVEQGLMEKPQVPQDPQSLWPDPRNQSLPVAVRARSYLASNCSYCHHPDSKIPAPLLDLRFLTPLQKTGVFLLGRIVRGHPEKSTIWKMLGGPGHLVDPEHPPILNMPPVRITGPVFYDLSGLLLIQEWIKEM